MKIIIPGLCAVMLCLTALPVHAEVKYQHIPGKKFNPGTTTREDAPKSDNVMVTKLDKNNITAFIQEVQHIVMNGSATMTQPEIADYFKKHIAEKAMFDSTMKYEMPGYPAQENAMQIGKTEYIDGILNGASMMKSYEHSVEIKKIEIGKGGRSAHVTTVTREKGEMPWPKQGEGEDGPPELVPMPVSGTSTCEQTIIISLTNYIQMQRAECYTALSFDPFENEELGSDMFFGR
ncbi:MAG: hypothetical protein KKA05_05880 [Alphaproteobacteria bacterium]|nr:hypothetical protein [Alphaproteobacteria bacterium]MBU0858352.1 hypothetical protein [Alphaproteobacteria bacterium]